MIRKSIKLAAIPLLIAAFAIGLDQSKAEAGGFSLSIGGGRGLNIFSAGGHPQTFGYRGFHPGGFYSSGYRGGYIPSYRGYSTGFRGRGVPLNNGFHRGRLPSHRFSPYGNHFNHYRRFHH